ncbi:glycosyltransferase family 4 protein [Arthrobacter tumbae]|uniref:glycosyltransferase family 4 protein n=1 Tax=Arthrobacter tumbae TaxID=163874 RepID=UPI00195C69F8|nr:glycosyltransferase family 4 protein [Arthrobacter tumbae]MBM7782537.1 glycosyltransferase involved in cell wall biosynthesis [Arthrobacter tumbae]
MLRNIRLTAATAVQHLDDDPVLLLLQISRRLPSRIVQPVAGIVRKVGRGPLLSALSAHLRGDEARRSVILDEAHRDGVTGAAAARLADVALAANEPQRADMLLERAGAAPGTRARRRWYDGDMTGAVAELTSAGLHRKAQRLESELRVFRGWIPTLEPVQGYEPQPQTVLHVLTNSLPHTGSGYAQRSHSILTAQEALGWNVHAATRLGYPVQVGKLFAQDTDVLNGVTYHRLIPARMPTGFDQRLQVQAEVLLDLALKIRPAVLHTTTHFVNGLVTRAVAEALGVPWVYEVRGQLADTWASVRGEAAKSSERYNFFTEREAAMTRSAALVVTLGEAMRQQILTAGDLRGGVLLCPNAVGEAFLDEPLDSQSARALLGLPHDGVFVGTVSSLVEYEGLDVLLRAIAMLAGEHPGLQCLIVGDGVAASALRQLAGELGITSRVTFTGRVPRKHAHLYHQALDIFVVPRRDLAVTRAVTPLKPVEAMASARPVVASNLPALNEIVEDSVTGTLVVPDSAEELAAALKDLIREDGAVVTDEARAMGATSRVRVLKERTWTGTTSTLLRAYQELGTAG